MCYAVYFTLSPGRRIVGRARNPIGRVGASARPVDAPINALADVASIRRRDIRPSCSAESQIVLARIPIECGRLPARS
jgi:hypothetical protein